MQKVFYGIGGFVALLLLVGLLLPGQSRFAVSTIIDAPAASVYALIDTPRQAWLWSRTRENDPDAEVRYAGPMRGEGATISWDGLIGGSGTETITTSTPYASISKVLNPGEPGEAALRYEVSSTAQGSEITLRFSHDHGLNVVARYMGLLLTGVLRRDYATGLDNLARLAESLPGADFSGLEVAHIEVEPVPIAWLPTSSAPSAGAVSDALGDAYFRILNVMQKNGLQASGPPRSILREFSGARRLFDAAIPVAKPDHEILAAPDGVRLGIAAGGPAIRVKHLGSYRDLRETHRQIAAYLAAYGIEAVGDPWESYVSDPADTAEEKLLTYIYYPLSAER